MIDCSGHQIFKLILCQIVAIIGEIQKEMLQKYRTVFQKGIYKLKCLLHINIYNLPVYEKTKHKLMFGKNLVVEFLEEIEYCCSQKIQMYCYQRIFWCQNNRDCFKGYSVPDPVLSSYSGYQAVPKTQEEKRESISAGVRTSTDIIENPLITPMKEVLHLKI